MKDVGGVAETRSLGRMAGRWDGRMDRQNNAHMEHGETRVISIVPLRLRRVTKNFKQLS